MSTYMIAYDLHGEPPSVYADLIKALEHAQAKRAQESVWILSSD